MMGVECILLVFIIVANLDMMFGMTITRHGALIPTRVVDGLSDKRIVQVLASEHKTLVLDQDGNVYMWGCHRLDVLREPMPFTMITEFIADGSSIKPKIVQFSLLEIIHYY